MRKHTRESDVLRYLQQDQDQCNINDNESGSGDEMDHVEYIMYSDDSNADSHYQPET